MVMKILDRFPGRSSLKRVGTSREEIERLRARLLSENDLFRGVAPEEMSALAGMLPMATCKRGQLLYAPGETGEALFILKAGQVRLYRIAADGRKLVLGTVGPGTVFGEMAAVGQSMTDSFAEAVDDAVVCIMSRIDIEQVMLDHPSVAVQLVRVLSSRLHDAEKRLEQFAFAPVPERVARLLLSLAQNGEVAGYSHQELADMIGTSRETVSRAMVDLKTAGIVEIDRRCIKLLDIAALQRQCGEPE
ncbi:MAG: Crp/Fnr family transcriptional regulator [Dehalococcoidia bacterium]